VGGGTHSAGSVIRRANLFKKERIEAFVFGSEQGSVKGVMVYSTFICSYSVGEPNSLNSLEGLSLNDAGKVCERSRLKEQLFILVLPDDANV
jgi:hypothetical protein